MKKDFKITIYPMTSKEDIKEAKAVVKALKTEPDGTSSAFECIEIDTSYVHQVTTYTKKDGKLQLLKRSCILQRVTPLQIEVKVQYGKTTLEVSWYAEGSIDDKPCLAEICTLARWQDGWYGWFYANEDGTPKAPSAIIYINEESI